MEEGGIMWVIVPDEAPHRRVAHGLFFDESMAVLYGNDTFGVDEFEAMSLSDYLEELAVEFTDVHKDDTI
jgi:hypothetical protein